MKQLNFTAKEVLKSLLDKTKEQTIRRAFKKCNMCVNGEIVSRTSRISKGVLQKCSSCNGTGFVEKPAKFKLGDEVELVWDYKKHTHPYFCKLCGFSLQPEYTGHSCAGMSKCWDIEAIQYNKIIGKVKITEVFKVKLVSSNCSYSIIPCKEFYVPDLNLGNKDGFKNDDEMFKYLNKHYDLSTPREFHVYRFKWL